MEESYDELPSAGTLLQEAWKILRCLSQSRCLSLWLHCTASVPWASSSIVVLTLCQEAASEVNN